MLCRYLLSFSSILIATVQAQSNIANLPTSVPENVDGLISIFRVFCDDFTYTQADLKEAVSRACKLKNMKGSKFINPVAGVFFRAPKIYKPRRTIDNFNIHGNPYYMFALNNQKKNRIRKSLDYVVINEVCRLAGVVIEYKTSVNRKPEIKKCSLEF